MLVAAIAMALLALATPALAASPVVVIDGHFKEVAPKGNPPQGCYVDDPHPCGTGQLKGFGKATEAFLFESFDGIDANGCAMVTGTDTFTLDDAEHSSFMEREHDVACHPGNMENAPGQQTRSYGFPGTDSGTWTFLPGTGTGAFANICSGAGIESLHFGGASGIPIYKGQLVAC